MTMTFDLLLSVIAVSMTGALCTYFAIHKFHQPTVRASSSATLIFVFLLNILKLSYAPALQAAFFGATFVGMTDKSRLGWKRVTIASCLFAIIFLYLLPFAKGIGGGLGTAAFIASSFIYYLSKKMLRTRS